MPLVRMIGKACINAPYRINDRQPNVLSQRNFRSLLTNREMASNMDAIYPSNAPIVSIMMRGSGYFLVSGFSVEMTGALIVAGVFSAATCWAFCSVFAGSVVAAGFAGAEFRGAPTAISQRWPGCPCGGFIPGAVFVAGAVTVG